MDIMANIELVAMIAKCLFIFVVLVHVVPIMVWIERRGSALMQNRLGPNRVGPLGLIQSLADALKFLFKEDGVPGHVNRFYYLAAPMVSVIPAFMTFAVIPFASSIQIGGTEVKFQLAELNIGLLYIFAIASLGLYGIIIAGWASNSKYALFGSLRSTAQMISYELSMGLSVIGILMIYSSVELGEIARGQGQVLLDLGWIQIPKWGIFVQPLGFLIFITAAYAETNRLPFDLPEGESEIVAGYHLEYGAFKFALFMMAEYLNMTTAAGLLATLYFGGWQLLPGMPTLLAALPLQGIWHEWARVGLELSSFAIKVGFFMWLFVWVRWTLPRFRYDQLMDLGWKVMLPLSLFNIVATAMVIYWGAV
jgi:NADH-quinone oxidoreductase subunit H